MKKNFTFLLGMMAMTTSLWSQSMPTSGAGTPEDPYQIESLDHLLWVSEGDGGTTDPGVRWAAHYILMADIDAASTSTRNYSLSRDVNEGFIPIGNGVVPFSGSFNGNMHTISNLYIDNELEYSGLFGKVEVADVANYIKDLTLADVDIKVGQNGVQGGYYGALAGRAVSMLITNCHATGTLAGREGAQWLGGLVGYYWLFPNVSDLLADNTPAISDCSSAVNITSSVYNVGGLIGELLYESGQKDHPVANCLASGDVTSGSNVGGFVGRSSGATLTNCHASGNVTATLVGGQTAEMKYAGGFSSFIAGEANHCSASGDVSSTVVNTGGFTGYLQGFTSQCYATGNVVSTNTRTGGFCGAAVSAGPSDLLMAEYCYSTGSVSGTTEVGGFSGYIYDYGVVFVLNECYTTSPVTGTANVNGFAGLIAPAGPSNAYNRCYWDVETTGQSKFLGEAADEYAAFGLNTADFAVEANLVGWDFDNIWDIKTNAIDAVARPYFKWQDGVLSIPLAGSGTVEDPYQIQTLGNLLWVSEGDGGTTAPEVRWAAHYILMADIDAASTSTRNYSLSRDVNEGFIPIGNGVVPFSGSFNGNMHTISNLYIDNELEYSGLFGKVEVADVSNYIKDLTLADVDIKVGQNGVQGGYYGALAGRAVSMLITNCHATGTLAGREGAQWLGGLVGYYWLFPNVSDLLADNTPAISDCSSAVNITSSVYNVGGLIGELLYESGQKDHPVANCLASGDVTSGSNVGGFVGRSSGATLTNCHASGNVTATLVGGQTAEMKYAGGFASFIAGEANHCSASGDVSSTVVNTGGFTGYLQGFTSQCYATGNVVSTNTRTGGFCGAAVSAGPSDLLMAEYCYSTGSVSGTTEVGGFSGYIYDYGVVFVLNECYTTSPVTGTANVNGFAGLIAPAGPSNAYNRCYWDVETTGQSKFLGEAADEYADFGLNTADFAVEANLVGWDFTNVWHLGTIAVVDVNERPYFQWQILDNPTAVSDIASDLVVMPNPTTGNFTVSNITVGNHISLYALTGSKVLEVKAQSDNVRLDISNQPNGIYILKVGNETYKIVKK